MSSTHDPCAEERQRTPLLKNASVESSPLNSLILHNHVRRHRPNVAGFCHEAVSIDQKKEVCESSSSAFNQNDESSANYRGVLVCLFRAIAYRACLRSGEEAPDDDRQRAR
ncbi:OTU domain-containing protein [Cucumis melo var. makuwa]|uniref:OTU domain-containing protein n=1 Tax=Cucumis melo var. makuwa TaxID=1194695 RepID=A0A5D3D532_CUCMM|nr:OTU domain-containing protein [Cucumis melo var. makuwa]